VKLIVARIIPRIIIKVGNYEFILVERDYLDYRRLITYIYRDTSTTYNSNSFSYNKKES
jgi:hypothetical protein